MEYWTNVMAKANGSSFARGDNDRAQKLGFEFIMRHSVEITEGKYDRAKAAAPPTLGRYVEIQTPDSELPNDEFLAKNSMKNGLRPVAAASES